MRRKRRRRSLLSFMLTFSQSFISQVIPFCARREVSLCVLLQLVGQLRTAFGEEKCIIFFPFATADFYKCKNSLFQASEFFLVDAKMHKILNEFVVASRKGQNHSRPLFFALPLLSAISIRLITLVFGIISEGDQELSLGASSCA